MDIRCQYKLHGIIISEGVLEVKCDSRLCGANSGVVVLHRFDLKSGELVETLRYKQPRKD